MVSLFIFYFCIISVSFFLSLSRFLNCLIILENFNVLILTFCLLLNLVDSHMLFIILIIVSTIEIIVGLVVLTCIWECLSDIELISF